MSGIITAAALVLGATADEKPPKLTVWTGARPAGKTWAKPGPDGEVAVVESDGKQVLRLHFTGDGYRGCGVNWHGWFPPDAGTDAGRYNALVFHVRQLTRVAGADLSVNLADNLKRPDGANPSNAVRVVADGGLEAIDGTWRRVALPLEKFTQNKPLDLKRLWQVDFSHVGKGEIIFEIDRIGFAVESFAPPRFKPGPAYRATATIDVGKELHPVRDEIYGVCDLPPEKLAAYGIPVTRWGGNPATRYNWKLGADNGAADWFFKNRGGPLARPEDTGYLTHVLGNRKVGATTYQTVPMIGWVAKDNRGYGFSVRKYGPQQATEPGHPDVGNGVRPDGKPVTGTDPRDTSAEAPPAFVGEAVAFVVKHAGPADKGGVRYWVLDNEPMLWHKTHRDVHPDPVNEAELWDRTVRYATAIKEADPTAKVAGFCSWGYLDLFYSAAEMPDGKVPERSPGDLGESFLRKCAEHRKSAGKPLVDVFDVHWYPQGRVKDQAVYEGKGMGPELNALRMRSLRDLYDPNYVSESWIKNAGKGEPVALIPRVRGWIAKHNPGMELCVGEYNFGGSDNITGGLAQAEAFGVFAREQVDLAFIWHTPEGSQELAWKLFRDYDDKQGRFGNRFLHGRSDHPDLSVFPARRTRDGAITVVVVNKNLHGACELELRADGLRGEARAWRFDQDAAGKVVEVRGAAGRVDGAIRGTLPAASATLFVVAPNG